MPDLLTTPLCLVTTFATAPLTEMLYPEWYQRKLDLWKKGKIDWDTGALIASGADDDDEERARASSFLSERHAATV